MEKREHHVIRLLQNRQYPTYQLYAEMANKKTAPRDGLRLAALTTMEWLRQRLQDGIPPELDQPEPSRFREVSDECLNSFHMSSGFVIDIVSLPEQGLWTLQITEPDLGSDPGCPDQERQPVPGRVFVTNVGFLISGQTLECAFQSVISDPEFTAEQADVYRITPARRLMVNPSFGLRQITVLGSEAEQIGTVSQIKNLIATQKHEKNHLPIIVFTHARQESQTPRPMAAQKAATAPFAIPPKAGLGFPAREGGLPMPIIPDPAPAAGGRSLVPYDVDAFAKDTVTFARTCLLSDELLNRFNTEAGVKLRPGDILMMEPGIWGVTQTVYPFRANRRSRDEGLDKLRKAVLSYPRGKAVSFGNVHFLSAARQNLMDTSLDALRQSEAVSDQYALDFAVRQERWNTALAEKEQENQELRDQLSRQREYVERLEGEKAELRETHKKELDALHSRVAAQDQAIEFYKRKLDQPKEHSEIAAWVKKYFDGRLLLHPKAVNLLSEKSAQGVDTGLICDALDFLATDYWDNRYLRISDHEMYGRCSDKYGRRFEIKPTGENTINFTPGQYKIKYYSSPRTGKPMESGLDYHLRVGSDPENLLRIYFLHDDGKKLIVVGSLPRHLRAVTIK